MIDYFYTVELINGRSVRFRELNFLEFKNMQKFFLLDDVGGIEENFLNMLNDLSLDGDLGDLSLYEVLLLALKIRVNNISGEYSIKTHESGESVVKTVDLHDVVSRIEGVFDKIDLYVDLNEHELIKGVELSLSNDTGIEYFIVNLNGEESKVGFDREIYENMPYLIKSKVDQRLDGISNMFSNTVLFDYVGKDGKKSEFCVFSDKDYIYRLIRGLLKHDLKSLYQTMLNIKKHLGIGFDEMRYITYNEKDLYVAMFNEQKQRERERQNEQNPKNSLPNYG